MSAPRRQARKQALQILYQLDMNQELSPQLGLSHFEAYFSEKAVQDEFAKALVLGVREKLESIDDFIGQASEHWRPDRMTPVDRNILRLGVYELMHREDIPHNVTINEMVELAKEFGEKTSPSFINGVLDKIHKSHSEQGLSDSKTKD